MAGKIGVPILKEFQLVTGERNRIVESEGGPKKLRCFTPKYAQG
jgi:hypothetical protein